MWVIVAKNSKNEVRDGLLSEILDIQLDRSPELFLKKKGLRYQICHSLSDALIYKQKSSCDRLLERYESSNKNDYRSVFVWIKDYVLTYRKVSKEEWHRMCDEEISAATIYYTSLKNGIEKKRLLIK